MFTGSRGLAEPSETGNPFVFEHRGGRPAPLPSRVFSRGGRNGAWKLVLIARRKVVSSRLDGCFLVFFFFFSFRKIATIELSISRKGRKEGINAIGLVRGTKKIVRCGVERRLNGLDRLRSGTD